MLDIQISILKFEFNVVAMKCHLQENLSKQKLNKPEA